MMNLILIKDIFSKPKLVRRKSNGQTIGDKRFIKSIIFADTNQVVSKNEICHNKIINIYSTRYLVVDINQELDFSDDQITDTFICHYEIYDIIDLQYRVSNRDNIIDDLLCT